MELLHLEKLNLYINAKNLKRQAILLTKEIPVYEKFHNRLDILRTVRSVTANIAEGYGRFHYQEMMQFCRISRGSLYELLDHFDSSLAMNYISDEEFEDIQKQIISLIKQINGYIRYLNKMKNSNTP